MKKVLPHPRTFRKAREQIKSMVTHGIATQLIKNYLLLWCRWWAKTVKDWSVKQLLQWLFENTHQDCLKLLIQAVLQDKSLSLSQSHVTPGALG